MNEEELFRAYNSLRRLTPEEQDQNESLVEDGIRHLGYVKCIVPGCITLIAAYAERRVCRYHARLSTESTDA